MTLSAIWPYCKRKQSVSGGEVRNSPWRVFINYLNIFSYLCRIKTINVSYRVINSFACARSSISNFVNCSTCKANKRSWRLKVLFIFKLMYMKFSLFLSSQNAIIQFGQRVGRKKTCETGILFWRRFSKFYSVLVWRIWAVKTCTFLHTSWGIDMY